MHMLDCICSGFCRGRLEAAQETMAQAKAYADKRQGFYPETKVMKAVRLLMGERRAED